MFSKRDGKAADIDQAIPVVGGAVAANWCLIAGVPGVNADDIERGAIQSNRADNGSYSYTYGTQDVRGSGVSS